MNLIIFTLQMAVLGCTLFLCARVNAQRRAIKKLIHDEIDPVRDLFAAVGELRAALQDSAPGIVVTLEIGVTAESGLPTPVIIAHAFRATTARLRATQAAHPNPTGDVV